MYVKVISLPTTPCNSSPDLLYEFAQNRVMSEPCFIGTEDDVDITKQVIANRKNGRNMVVIVVVVVVAELNIRKNRELISKENIIALKHTIIMMFGFMFRIITIQPMIRL